MPLFYSRASPPAALHSLGPGSAASDVSVSIPGLAEFYVTQVFLLQCGFPPSLTSQSHQHYLGLLLSFLFIVKLLRLSFLVHSNQISAGFPLGSLLFFFLFVIDFFNQMHSAFTYDIMSVYHFMCLYYPHSPTSFLKAPQQMRPQDSEGLLGTSQSWLDQPTRV